MADERPLTEVAQSPIPSPSPPSPQSRWQRFKGNWWLYARWLVPSLLVVVLGLSTGAALYVFTHNHLFTGNQVASRPATDTKTFTWPLTLSKRVNILLIGIDVSLSNKRQPLNFARSDTLILISLDPERNQISALSIPRDSRALIPGKGETKINAAYAYGGPRLTIKTVQNFLSVPIHYYVKLGAESAARIIDAIGGVDLYVEKDMKYKDWWGGVDINLKKGLQHLDGQRAMDYVRFRHDDMADIGRVGRQQTLLLALFEKIKSPAVIVHAPQLLRAFAENTQTNLSPHEMITLGMFGVRLKSEDIHTATLPGRASDAYWDPDWVKTRPLVTEMFYGVDKDTLASTGVELINGSGVPGLGRRTAQRLQQVGFKIVRVNSTSALADVTTIIDRSGQPHVVRLLADLLGRSRIIRATGAGPDITIVLARDQVNRQVAATVLARR